MMSICRCIAQGRDYETLGGDCGRLDSMNLLRFGAVSVAGIELSSDSFLFESLF
jgi:hypothetical protein